MSITAAMVKELRQATGAGMMDCKRALKECEGDMEEAKTYLRKKGIADSAKRADRTASEGKVIVRIDGARALLLELNCETDFVARNPDFGAFADSLAELAIKQNAGTLGDLMGGTWDGTPVETAIAEKSGTIGEKLEVGRLAWVSLPEGSAGGFGSYLHDGGKIGVAVALNTATAPAAHNAHVQALAKHH